MVDNFLVAPEPAERLVVSGGLAPYYQPADPVVRQSVPIGIGSNPKEADFQSTDCSVPKLVFRTKRTSENTS
jgi:hypothetical protein